MKFSNDDLFNELAHIELNFEFSDSCPHDLKQYILDGGYAQFYDEVLQLTNKGEEEIGMDLDGLELDDDADIDMYKRYTVNDEEF